MSVRRGMRSVLSLPLVLQDGVVSLKYGTPYLMYKKEERKERGGRTVRMEWLLFVR
jgi:hypothetical protein